jgi:hypothetical protein
MVERERFILAVGYGAMFKGIADIESPYDGATDDIIRRNILYARAACKDALLRGYVPYASHLFFTQPGLLDDKVPEERELGMEAGKALIREAAGYSLFYMDLGMSKGMQWGKQDAIKSGRIVEEVRILPEPGASLSYAELLELLRRLELVDDDYTRLGW